MRFSVAIPCYNQAEYLPDAIDSVLEQTYPAHEIIIVNDGSPDNTKEVAERYASNHKNIRVINQVNKGLASARNSAIMAMSGDYLYPLDADDILVETCLERINQVAKETSADIIAPSLKCFGIGNDTIILDKNLTVEDFRIGNRLGYFSAIKKEALLECGGYSPRMVHGYEDYHLWFDLLSREKKLETIQEPLVLYRTKKVSMWKDAQEHHKELMEQIYKDFPQVWPKK